MKTLALFGSLVLTLIGCDSAAAPAPAPAPASASPAAPAPASVQSSESAVDEATLAEAPTHEELLAFCRFTFDQTVRCFADDAYWDTFATMFYAFSDDPAVDPEAKAQIIGTMKDDVLNLQSNDPTFTPVCENMLATMLLPTKGQMRSVEASVPHGCVKYAQSLGLAVYRDKVFFDKMSD